MTDDELARRILLPLDEHPEAPSRVDIAAAVATGTKRRRAQRAAVTAVAMAAGLAVAAVPAVISRSAPPVAAATGGPSATTAPSSAPAPAYDRTTTAALPSSCTGEALPVPDGGQSYAHAVDPTGRYATYRTYRGGTQPVLWHEGVATKIGKPGGDDSLHDVNSHGVAVGNVWADDGPHGVVVSGGKSSPLPGGPADVRAINDHGVIVGGRPDESAALRWPSRGEQPVPLAVPKGYVRAMAYDVDGDGTVVGYVGEAGSGTVQRNGQNPARERVAYVWPAKGPGRVLEAPTLPGHVFDYYDARAISNGWVVGYASSDQGLVVGVRWDLNTGRAQVLPGLESSDGVNPYGWVVGMSEDDHAVLTDGVTTLRLPDVFPFDEKYGTNFATSVSDDGRTIVGNVDDATRGPLQQAVLWHCS
ncbi:hypothetical protein [Catellatospora sichuanensis]|uniref:hypothetical protein n=1 Tax=Catellatospora sichuanensis TaxID=1969805 RepID=UPI001181F4F2|nr:hypothetical protein [Catellatospora sichuanensis]